MMQQIYDTTFAGIFYLLTLNGKGKENGRP